MEIIKRQALESFWREEPQAKTGLQRWFALARIARWTSLQDVRRTFPHADQVIVRSGRPIVVFNVSGNKYRLITAIHYNRQRVYVMRFLTHAEYDKDLWKGEL